MWGYSDQEKSNMEGFFLKFESADILFHKYYLTPDTRLDRFFCNKSWKDYHNWYICKRVLQHTNTTNFKQLLFFFFNRYCTICTRFNIKSLHYGLSPIEKGDIKNFKFKALLHIQLWSKNVQTFFKWCQTPKSWLLILVFIIYVKYLRSYLQKTWRGGLTNLKFCVLANQLVPKKRVENNIFVRGPLHGANIGQIFSSPFSSENMFWNICSHF